MRNKIKIKKMAKKDREKEEKISGKNGKAARLKRRKNKEFYFKQLGKKMDKGHYNVFGGDDFCFVFSLF